MSTFSSGKWRRCGHLLALVLIVGVVFCIPKAYAHWFKTMHLSRIRQEAVAAGHATYDSPDYESSQPDAPEDFLFVVVENSSREKKTETYYSSDGMIVVMKLEGLRLAQTQRWNAVDEGQGLPFKFALGLLLVVGIKKMVRNIRGGDWRGSGKVAWSYWEKWLFIYGGVAFLASLLFMMLGVW